MTENEMQQIISHSRHNEGSKASVQLQEGNAYQLLSSHALGSFAAPM